MDAYKLIEVLQESVKRNGEKPLTNKWLLNIIIMVVKSEEAEEENFGEWEQGYLQDMING